MFREQLNKIERKTFDELMTVLQQYSVAGVG